MEQFSNNARTTLSNTLANDSTTVVVEDYSDFPASASFRIKIADELLLVTGGAGTSTWTVTRAIEFTSIPDVAHPSGTSVKHVLTAGGLQQTIEDALESFPGVQGVQGSQGFQGDVGVQGSQGSQGVQGTQGFQGDVGSQGSQGNQGFQGFQGDVGSQGFQGVQGTQGDVGVQGVQGSQGFQGDVGTGTQGFQGDIGSQGNQGDIGTQGPQGFQGDVGTGTQGFQGDIGTQGPQGFQGDVGTGTQGFQGDIGTQGPQGFQGDVGAQGPQGATGDPSDIRLKMNLVPFESGLEFVNKFQVYNYEWNHLMPSLVGQKETGLIAQDIEKIYDAAVIHNDTEYLKLNYAKLVPFLIKAIQELSEKVKKLENS